MKGGMRMIVSKFKIKNCERRIECHTNPSIDAKEHNCCSYVLCLISLCV